MDNTIRFINDVPFLNLDIFTKYLDEKESDLEDKMAKMKHKVLVNSKELPVAYMICKIQHKILDYKFAYYNDILKSRENFPVPTVFNTNIK